MREDRLRALRGLRFAGRFEFSIEPETWEAIVASAPFLTQLSAERVKEELTKTMVQVARPSRSLGLWQESGALSMLVPTLATLDRVTLAALDCLAQPPERADPRSAARADARRLARLAALFLGCPPPDAQRSLRALRFSNADTEWITALVEAWRGVGADMEWALVAGGTISDGTIRRWVARAGRLRIPTLLRLAAARWAASREAGGPAPAPNRVRSLYRRAVRSAFHDAVELSNLAVDGNDLLEAGIAHGPQVGAILRRLLAAVVEDQSINVRDQLLALARRFAADGPTA
jgi:tRNA nucleotidyltransferase (CCA-adding enzyme)